MIVDGEAVALAGRHFLARISLPENFASGLINVNKDPRKQKKKPDAYVGTVEEVAPGCIFVKPGDQIVFRRWTWGQMDVGDEHIVAEEDDILIMGENVPAPGVIVLRLIDQTPKTALALPQNLRPEKTALLKGEVLAFSPYRMGGELKEILEVGRALYFERSDTNQWSYGDGRVAIKVCSYFEIMAFEEKAPALSVV